MVTETVREPDLRKIKGGWAALGDGWAVHGATREEAVQRYYTAAELRVEISQRPDPTAGLQAGN